MVTFLKYLARKRAHLVSWNVEKVVRQGLEVLEDCKEYVSRKATPPIGVNSTF
jgi:hypothetical protein